MDPRSSPGAIYAPAAAYYHISVNVVARNSITGATPRLELSPAGMLSVRDEGNNITENHYFAADSPCAPCMKVTPA